MEKSGKGLLDRSLQDKISIHRPMPVDNVSSDYLTEITGETVQLYYYTSASVLTLDSGEAMGTVVVGKLVQRNIKNALGDVAGTHKDSSLSFTSTALVTEREFPYLSAELYDIEKGLDKATIITNGLTNGEYCVDYRTGTIYGIKGSITTTLTSVLYKIETSAVSSPSSVSSNINLSKVDGISLSDTNPVPVESTAVATTTGFSTYFNVNGNSTATSIKATAGNIYAVTASNLNSAIAYIQLFDAISSTITVGTTTPNYVFPLPAGGGYDAQFIVPMTFSTAISYACTTTPTGAISPTSSLTVSMGYK